MLTKDDYQKNKKLLLQILDNEGDCWDVQKKGCDECIMNLECVILVKNNVLDKDGDLERKKLILKAIVDYEENGGIIKI